MCAWATPATAVTGAVAEAADFNNHRDNINETAVAKSTAAGDMTYATGANALARLAIGTAGQELMVNSSTSAPAWITRGSTFADVATVETTTSTSYTDLATAGPSVTLSPGVAKDHLILFGSGYTETNGNTGTFSVAVAGATATDVDGIVLGNDLNASSRKVGFILASAQASGATHTMKYRVAASSATGSFRNRRIVGVVI